MQKEFLYFAAVHSFISIMLLVIYRSKEHMTLRKIFFVYLNAVPCHEAFILIFVKNVKENCFKRYEMFKCSDFHYVCVFMFFIMLFVVFHFDVCCLMFDVFHFDVFIMFLLLFWFSLCHYVFIMLCLIWFSLNKHIFYKWYLKQIYLINQKYNIYLHLSSINLFPLIILG